MAHHVFIGYIKHFASKILKANEEGSGASNQILELVIASNRLIIELLAVRTAAIAP